MFDVPVMGTHAHSWIMSFPSEYEAFKLCQTVPTLHSSCGYVRHLKIRCAERIRVFQEMRAEGIHSKSFGIRLDSGDLAYLSKKARKMLDELDSRTPRFPLPMTWMNT